MRFATLFSSRLLLLLVCLVAITFAFEGEQPVSAPDFLHKHEKRVGSGGPYWYSQIKRQGTVPYGFNSSYVIWRNVMDYGAKGDGVTDDTFAINNATQDYNRCTYNNNCNSQTTTPAIVYFPAGTYIISQSIVMPYYTQCVGDANNLPIIRGTPDFYGIGLFDSDPYLAYGYSWFQNQNNFWRHVRNFILDLTEMPVNGAYHGIHWQVAQGTSLQNIVFNMIEGNPNSTQYGIFMDNGSGGMFEDLIFNGGGVGFYAGNQQWTARNLTFNGCNTAIFQNWNWVFNYKSITINNCNIGIDMSQGSNVPATGSIVLLDSVMNNVATAGILTSFGTNSTPVAAATLILDNVDFTNTPNAVALQNGTVIVQGDQTIASFVQGRAYTAYDSEEMIGNLTCYEPAADGARVQQLANPPPKPASLLDNSGTGAIYERGKPQYEGVPVENFVSILDYGCIGDGATDTTECVQAYFNSITADEIAFIDHGAYVIRETIQIPKNIRMVGEIWPYFMVDGTSSTFSNINNPQPAFRVGNPGDVGAVEMSEIIFQTLGPAPGAILMEWNLAQSSQGSNGMWDVHWRLGGSNGTQLQSDKCSSAPLKQNNANSSCIASFLMVHLTSTAQVLMSNNWGWLADHELDLVDHNQISLYNGRGLLIESQGPTWLYGSSFEHSMLYNYQFANAKEIYGGHLQSETAYMQANPNALQPYSPLTSWSDPTFSECFASTCFKTYGLRVFNSTYILLYGTGFYSFFDNYDSGCLLTSNCQQNMVSIEESEAIYIYALNTVGAYNMVEVDLVEVVPSSVNPNSFCDTLAVFEYP